MKLFLYLIFLTFPFIVTAQNYNKELYQYYLKEGMIASDKEKYDVAVHYFTNAIKIYSGEARAYVGRSLALRKLNQLNKALANCDTAIAINPKDNIPYYFRAILREDQNQWKLALEDYNRAIDLSRKPSADLYVSRASIKIRNEVQDYEGAVKDLSKAIKQSPDYVKAYSLRGMAWFHLGLTDKALKDFDKSIALNPQCLRCYSNKGYVLLMIKEYEQSIETCTEALKLDSLSIHDYNNRGYSRMETGKYQEALQDFHQSLLLDSTYAYGYNNRGYVYYHLEKYDEAMKDINRSIVMDSTNSYAYRNRALVYLKTGDKEKACTDLEESLRLIVPHIQKEVEELKKSNCGK